MELSLRTELRYHNLGVKKTKGRAEFTFCIHFTKEYTLESVLVYFFYDIYSRNLKFRFASKGDASFDIKKEVYKLYKETDDEDFEMEEYTMIQMTDFEKEVLKECKRITKENDFKINDFEKEYCDKVREEIVMEQLKLNFSSWMIQRFDDREEGGLFHYYLFTHDNKILKIDTYRDDYEAVEELEKKAVQVQLKDLKKYTDGFEINIKKLDLDRLQKVRPILEELKLYRRNKINTVNPDNFNETLDGYFEYALDFAREQGLDEEMVKTLRSGTRWAKDEMTMEDARRYKSK